MPRRTREAMLRGIRRNRIIAGAYADKESGGICPMLAAHRNGGRTNFGVFAIAWDEFTGETGASNPRRATRREVGALLSYLEHSLLDEGVGHGSLRDAVQRIRLERRSAAARAARSTAQPDLATLLEPIPAGERPNPEPDPFPGPVPEPGPVTEPEPMPDPVPEPIPDREPEPVPMATAEAMAMGPVGLDRSGDPLVERIVDEVLLRR
jgi:hypothetical protein